MGSIFGLEAFMNNASDPFSSLTPHSAWCATEVHLVLSQKQKEIFLLLLPYVSKSKQTHQLSKINRNGGEYVNITYSIKEATDPI